MALFPLYLKRHAWEPDEHPCVPKERSSLSWHPVFLIPAALDEKQVLVRSNVFQQVPVQVPDQYVPDIAVIMIMIIIINFTFTLQ